MALVVVMSYTDACFENLGHEHQRPKPILVKALVHQTNTASKIILLLLSWDKF